MSDVITAFITRRVGSLDKRTHGVAGGRQNILRVQMNCCRDP